MGNIYIAVQIIKMETDQYPFPEISIRAKKENINLVIFCRKDEKVLAVIVLKQISTNFQQYLLKLLKKTLFFNNRIAIIDLYDNCFATFSFNDLNIKTHELLDILEKEYVVILKEPGEEICPVCGIGALTNKTGGSCCDFCHQKPPDIISPIDWQILAKKVLLQSNGNYLEDLFIPSFIATELQKPNCLAEFKSHLPENVADRIFLKEYSGYYSIHFAL